MEKADKKKNEHADIPKLPNTTSAPELGTTPIEPISKVAIYTGGLLAISSLTICYFAAEIILPICIAFILNLVLRPSLRMMRAIKIPRGLAAILIILILVGLTGALGTALSGPTTEWGQKLPEALPKLQDRLQFLIKPVSTIQKTVKQAETVTAGQDGHTMSVDLKSDGLSERLFSSTSKLIAGIFETLLVLFFFLISGDTFQQRFIEILPRVQDKKKALQISRQIEADIAAYMRTITMMNFLVGSATTAIMYFCGVPDPILWGTIAFLFNFVPILGPIAAACVFVLVGMLSSGDVTMSLIPAALYFGVHIIEGEVATPLILSNRFTLNPALVILMLIVWFWIWGVAGAILSTPMLAILKIICDRTAKLKPFGHLIEG